MTAAPTYSTFGAHAVLVNWEASITPEVHDAVLQFDKYVSSRFSEEIIETVFAYQSLAIYLHESISANTFIQRLKNEIGGRVNVQSKTKYLARIPVCYDLEYAPDLTEVAHLHKISIAELILLHTQPTYTVYFLGFLPGFPYLGGLDPKIHTPRKSTPNPYVEKGSVGIGGGQTGVYSMASPGGWNIIGRTPIDFFSVEKRPPTFLQAGDYVQFVSISKKKYKKMLSDIEKGSITIEKEVIYG
ncbi:MAG: 5-oxoprolinase subunit PxpB [Altibacter sp.]|uniref:5-oxoprolinase subunit PxpB n=1 Tax=Altibacter sp. TaxID=2024823 RepID=UPI001D581F91|nr:5-oxoprolinase subunit PxpB [Altibacter sp.]MBZ0328211.1 5-oxoprolinase subunit PxpB [Altibacter sp.]